MNAVLCLFLFQSGFKIRKIRIRNFHLKYFISYRNLLMQTIDFHHWSDVRQNFFHKILEGINGTVNKSLIGSRCTFTFSLILLTITYLSIFVDFIPSTNSSAKPHLFLVNAIFKNSCCSTLIGISFKHCFVFPINIL